MAKITLDPIPSGFATTTALNARLEQIEDALNEDVLWRNNPVGEPNSMDNLLDMADNRIINLPDAVADHEPVTLSQIDALVEQEVHDQLAEEMLDVGTGNVIGAVSSTDNAIALFSGVTGKLLKEGPLLADLLTPLDTVADLSALTGVVAGRQFSVKEYNAGTSIGGGLFAAYSGSPTTDNFITFPSATAGIYFGRIGVENFTFEMAGAVGDGVVDDTAAMQRALDSGFSIDSNGAVTYKTTNTLFLTDDDVVVDFKHSKIVNTANSLYAFVTVTDAIGVKNEANLIAVLSNLHYGSEVQNSHVKNLVVQMSPITGGGNNLGVGIVYGKECTIEDLKVLQTNGNGCEVRNSTNCGVIRARLTPRTYGLFNFMSRDCYAENVYISGCDRGIIVKMSQGGATVNFRATRCIVENLNSTIYYTAGGEFKETVLTDPIYQAGHEFVSDVSYENCIFRSTIDTVKVDLSYWAERFRFVNCQFSSTAAAAGANIGLNGNQTVGDVQGKNHKFIGCTFSSYSTLGQVAFVIGADTLVEGCTFTGDFQRLIRVDGTYGAVGHVTGNIISGNIQCGSSLDTAVFAVTNSGLLNVTNNEIKLTAASIGTLASVSYNLNSFTDNRLTLTGSSSYDAFACSVSTGNFSNNIIKINGFAAVDALTITDAGLVTNNDFIHDGTSTGAARATNASSGAVQVRAMYGNTFSGWDTNQAASHANNVQFPVYADEAAAAVGVLGSGRLYKSADGLLRVKA